MNPEEQNPQSTTPQELSPQSVNPPVEKEATKTQEVNTPVETPAPVTQTPPPVAQPAPEAQKPVEGKKSKAWIIILVIIVLLLLGLFGAIYWTITKISGAAGKVLDYVSEEYGDESGSSKDGSGSASQGNTVVADNPILDANNKMREELGSFDYAATITSNAMGMSLDTVMDCTFDGKNKLEYCSTEVMGMSLETYYDWDNGYQYSKTTSPYSFAQTDDSWTKSAVPEGAMGAMNIGDDTEMTNIRSETVDGGTKYTGQISGFVAADSDSGTITENATMNFEILIGTDGYIHTMNMDMDSSGITQTIKIEYSNFGTASPLSIPTDALNS